MNGLMELKYLPQILPKKYADRERFKEFEVMEILDLRRVSLYYLRLSGELTPIITSDRRRFYTIEALESYLVRRNESAF